MHTPLKAEHQQHGAQWREWLGENVPGSYGDTSAEYSALRQGAGVIDLSVLGKLRITGDDRITYLQGQLSQDILPLQTAGVGAYSCLLKPTGQMLSDMVLFATEDAVIVLTPPHTVQTVRERLEQFVIMEDVEIEDVTHRLAVLHVAGKRANEALASLSLQTQVALWHGQTVLWQEQPLHAVRTDRCGDLGYDLIISVEMAKDLWRGLLDAGVRPVGYEAWNIRRVEAGIPLFGIDMDETTIPLEAGLGERAISFTKGCYTGQEVIHRIYSRGHTNRSLVGLRLNEDVLPSYRAPISTSDREDVGWVTSAVRSLALGMPIALGYLRNEYIAPGTVVTIRQEPSPVPAEVTTLPFVEPSRA
ncbi:MAG: aminomethyltransferase family protein [Armatimonadota bacterium]